MKHKSIKWNGIGTVQVTIDNKGHTYYYVGKNKTVEWWYNRKIKSWTIYVINGISGAQVDNANHVYGKSEVAFTVNLLAN